MRTQATPRTVLPSMLVPCRGSDEEFVDENAEPENANIVKPERGNAAARLPADDGDSGAAALQEGAVLGDVQNTQAANTVAALAAHVKPELGGPRSPAAEAEPASSDADMGHDDVQADSDWESDDGEVDEGEEMQDNDEAGAHHGPEPDILAFDDEEQPQEPEQAHDHAAEQAAAAQEAQKQALEFLVQPIAAMQAVVLPADEAAQRLYVDKALAGVTDLLRDVDKLCRHVFNKIKPPIGGTGPWPRCALCSLCWLDPVAVHVGVSKRFCVGVPAADVAHDLRWLVSHRLASNLRWQQEALTALHPWVSGGILHSSGECRLTQQNLAEWPLDSEYQLLALEKLIDNTLKEIATLDAAAQRAAQREELLTLLKKALHSGFGKELVQGELRFANALKRWIPLQPQPEELTEPADPADAPAPEAGEEGEPAPPPQKAVACAPHLCAACA